MTAVLDFGRLSERQRQDFTTKSTKDTKLAEQTALNVRPEMPLGVLGVLVVKKSVSDLRDEANKRLIAAITPSRHPERSEGSQSCSAMPEWGSFATLRMTGAD